MLTCLMRRNSGDHTVNSESTLYSDCPAANLKPLCESPDSWNTHTDTHTRDFRGSLAGLLFSHKRGRLTEVRRIDDYALRLPAYPSLG